MASTPYLGQISLFAFGFNPKYWLPCSGQIISIQQNTALFSLLGTTFGGNGTTTFGLPNFNGSVGIGKSTTYPLGLRAGTDNVTLNSQQIPSHNHGVRCTYAPGSNAAATNGFYSASRVNDAIYSNRGSNATMAPNMIGPAGGNQPHPNDQPSLGMGFYIAMSGIFPSRN